MRLTDKVINNMNLSNMQRAQERLLKSQQMAVSGLKISAPSDDPAGAQQVLQLKGILQDNDQYARNIVTGTAWLGAADNAMSGMGDVLARAQEIAMMLANGTANSDNRSSAVSEVIQLKNQLVQLGNTQVGGKYIFGGFKNDTAPFDPSQTSNPFNGTDDAVLMKVDRGTVQDNPGSFVAINYSGGRLLKGTGGGVDILGALDSLATALTNNDQAAIQQSLTTLDTSKNQILTARADMGSRMNRIESISANLETRKVDINENISGIEEIDVLKVYSDLASQQTAYQAALATASKVSQLSLLNYLR